ncbi:MAG TPA: DUF2726 domain-containing protein [Nitrospirales bacterium]|nr:DUF2726 domain-containing protein [Nitrospirales bacterium]
MSQNGLSLILLAGFMLGVVVLLRWIWRRPLPEGTLPALSSESVESVVTPRPLMSPEEATLYNLITLAARDHMLVLAKIPLLSVLSVVDKDEEARKAVMRTIQPVRCDVVLAHPGTLKVMTVITFNKDAFSLAGREERWRFVETLLKAAGIQSIGLQVSQTYSVEQLTGLLGLAEEE